MNLMSSAWLQAELDRFVNALIAIREEVREVENGKADKCVNNPSSINVRRPSLIHSPSRAE